jgi:hypothetical protein
MRRVATRYIGKLENIPTDQRTKVRQQMIAGTAANVVNIDDKTQVGFSIHVHLEDLTPYVETDAESLWSTEFLPTSFESLMFQSKQHCAGLGQDIR